VTVAQATPPARLRLTGASAVVFRLVSLGMTFVLAPVALDAYGTAGFAIWSVFSTVVTLLGFADLGLGLSLVTTLSAEHDAERRRRLIATSYRILWLLSAALIGGWLLSEAAGVDWFGLLGLSTAGLSDSAQAVVVGSFVVGGAIGMPTQLPERIHLAIGEGYLGLWFSISGQIVAIIGATAVGLGGGGLAAFCACTFLLPRVGGIANHFFLFHRHPELRPGRSEARRTIARSLLRLGVMFAWLNLMSAVALQSDILIVSRQLTANDVTDFTLLSRLFFVVPTLLTYAFQTLLPVYSKTLAEGALDQTRAVFRRAMRISLVAGVAASLFLAVAAPTIILIWTGHEVDVSTATLLLFATWATLYAVGPNVGTLINAARAVRFTVITSSVMAVVNVALSIALTDRIGLAGPIAGTVLSTFICLLAPAIWWYRHNMVGPTPRLAGGLVERRAPEMKAD
jgi:O-antigen/teichoic acid export membrane protein